MLCLTERIRHILSLKELRFIFWQQIFKSGLLLSPGTSIEPLFNKQSAYPTKAKNLRAEKHWNKDKFDIHIKI